MPRFSRLTSLFLLPVLAAPALAQVQAPVQTPAATTTVAQPGTIAPRSELPPATSSNDPAPPVPSPAVYRNAGVVRQAGRGGPTAYGREGVLELGGGLAFTSASDFLQLSIQPFVGYFLTNNFQLSFLANVSYSRIGHTKPEGGALKLNPASVALLVQPSVHLPITPTLFAYAGLGLGAGYLKASPELGSNHGWGFAFEPELGLNILIGRSGILSPSANVLLTANHVIKEANSTRAVISLTNAVGANLRYSVMF